MRVALISQDFYPMRGGIARHLMQMRKKYFSKDQFSVIVPRAIGRDEDYNELPFRTYRTTFNPFSIDRSEENDLIMRVLENVKPQVILFGYVRSHPEVGLQYREKHPRTKIGLVAHAKEIFIENNVVEKNHNARGGNLGYLAEEVPFYIGVLNRVDYIFAVSSFTKRTLQEQGVDGRICVVHPCVDASITCERTEHSGTRLLSVGRLIERKGQYEVVQRLPDIRESVPDIQYTIVGDGPMKSHIMDLIDRLGLQDVVTVYDAVDDLSLRSHYSSSDIFVLPTRHIPPHDVEGFGIVFIEAGLFGLPVIGGDSGGVPDAVIDGETGFLVDLKRQALEETIVELAKDKELRKTMGLRGRKRVLRCFNEIPSNELSDLFHSK